MLDAFLQKNVRRILVTRSEDHQADKNEDAITSMVFTPLRFMEPTHALTCFKSFLPSKLFKIIPRAKVVSYSLELWPLGLSAPGVSQEQYARCEPDLVAKFQFTDGTTVILIGEMKWEWRINADELKNEIRRQRRAVKDKYRNAQIAVFAILKYEPNFEAKQIACHELCTWKVVHSRLTGAMRDLTVTKESPPRIWASAICEFLISAEQIIFEGFRNVPVVENTTPIFFRAKPED